MKEERYEAILNLMHENNYLSVENICKHLFISPPTARRDLAVLQDMGLVVRSRGGAILRDDEVSNNSPLEFRTGLHSHEKILLVREAAKLLHDNCTIFLDESSTTFNIINLLPNYHNIHVISNSVNVLNQLYKLKIPAHCLGGELSFETMSFIGSMTEAMVRNFSIDIMFFSSSGVNRNGYIVDYFEPANTLRRAALLCSNLKVFLFDKSKIGKNSAYSLTHVSNIDYLITDGELPENIDIGNARLIRI